MQTKAIIRAAINVQKANPSWNVKPEIMIPLIGDVKELKYVKDVVVKVADAEIAASGVDLKYEVGTMISGKSDRLLYYGVFQNELYGEYLLCVRPSVENAIRINMEDQMVIFNYESEEVTAELCDTMEDFIAEKLTEEQVK